MATDTYAVQIEELSKRIDVIYSKIDLVNSKLSKCDKNLHVDLRVSRLLERTELKNKFENLSSKLNKKITNDSLKFKEEYLSAIDSVDRRVRELDFLLFNIPKQENENLDAIFENISHYIGLPNFLLISNIFRIPSRSAHKEDPILVKFTNVRHKELFIKQFRLITVQLKDIGFGDSNTNVKISECLTKRNAKIWKKAMEKKRELMLYGYFEVRHGVVIYRNRPNDNIRVTSESMLDYLCKMETERNQQC